MLKFWVFDIFPKIDIFIGQKFRSFRASQIFILPNAIEPLRFHFLNFQKEKFSAPNFCRFSETNSVPNKCPKLYLFPEFFSPKMEAKCAVWCWISSTLADWADWADFFEIFEIILIFVFRMQIFKRIILAEKLNIFDRFYSIFKSFVGFKIG